MDGESGKLREYEDVAGASAGKSETFLCSSNNLIKHRRIQPVMLGNTLPFPVPNSMLHFIPSPSPSVSLLLTLSFPYPTDLRCSFSPALLEILTVRMQ